jgi:kumamolisin
MLRRRPTSKVPSTLEALAARRERKYLNRSEFAAEHGADADDIAKIEKFARDNKLVVVQADPARRMVLLSGRVADFSKAFEVKLEHYAYPDGTYRGRTGAIQIPADLADVVTAVLGLDDRPQAKPRFQRLSSQAGATLSSHAQTTSYTPDQVAKMYDFPAGVDGQGQCIALIELGGGFKPADLRTYFKNHGLPVPKVSSVLVDGAHNQPTGDPGGPDGEVMLDIEVAGAVAPKANVVVYFAPNTDQGFLDALTKAIHDNTNKPSVISISWGGPESNWTAQAMQAFDQALQDAAALGVTVCCAAGDNGSGDGVSDGLDHVDFPASRPYALACGGTRLVGTGSTISSEVVWNDDPITSATGGGVSDFFDLPSYQQNAQVPPSGNPGAHKGRGVPDVAGNADPETGYVVRVDGTDTVIGGTSAVAPLWAGLIALINQRKGSPVGFINPTAYGPASSNGGFHDITSGDNGGYRAGPGWDACTGWGSPDGTKLANAL